MFFYPRDIMELSPNALMNKNSKTILLRNFIFGVEDSLVSTVGLLSGVAAAGLSKPSIILTGLILIFVEAFSMGAGSLISEHSADEYRGKNKLTGTQFYGGLTMLSSYFIAGILPIAPYALLDAKTAFFTSIAASLFGLIILGIIKAKIFKAKIFHHAFEVFLIGGIAIAIGVAIGTLLKNF